MLVQFRRNWTFTVTCAVTGFPSTRAGEYFHCFTESIAASRRVAGPLMALALATFPVTSTSAETTTVPCVLDCLAAAGYVGRVEVISFGSRTSRLTGAEA